MQRVNYRYGIMWCAVFGTVALMFLQLPQMAARQDSVVRTFSPLVAVEALIRQRYVETFSDDRLVDGAIRGMMYKLDPYSGYIAPDELPAFMRRQEGHYTGIGVVLGVQHGRVVVVAPVAGSPAAQAGILPGDVIVRVNDIDVEHRSLFEVDDMLTGTAQAEVRLTVRRDGEADPLSYRVTRGTVTLHTVQGLRRDEAGNQCYWADEAGRIGYIRIGDFRANTTAEFDDALRTLLDAGASGLVLDLRFNAGGHMEQAVNLADRFLAEGTIVSTVTRRKAVEEYQATAEGTVRRLRLAVLINGHTASAAEILAGALKDHRRAVIIGTRSFGKGSVQHLIPLEGDHGAIRLTVAYYRLPGGRIIHRTRANAHTEAWGIHPDVEVFLTADEECALRQARVQCEAGRQDEPVVFTDRQLQAAIAVLTP